MFAPTTHVQQDEQAARDRRRLDIVLVMVTGLSAVAAGLAMNAMSTYGVAVGFLPV